MAYLNGSEMGVVLCTHTCVSLSGWCEREREVRDRCGGTVLACAHRDGCGPVCAHLSACLVGVSESRR